MVVLDEVMRSQLFELDSARGVVRNRLTKGRTFMIGSSAWTQICEDIRSVYLSAGQTLIERMGFVYGTNMGRAAHRRNTEPAAFFDYITELASQAGWGNITLSAGDPTTGSARFRVENCIFCADVEPCADPVCEFMSGVIRGIADEILGGEHVVTEESCSANGQEQCTFFLENRNVEGAFADEGILPEPYARID
jgi:predicted hydrocarbon binding protein